jgi:hypothetical protein
MIRVINTARIYILSFLNDVHVAQSYTIERDLTYKKVWLRLFSHKAHACPPISRIFTVLILSKKGQPKAEALASLLAYSHAYQRYAPPIVDKTMFHLARVQPCESYLEFNAFQVH